MSEPRKPLKALCHRRKLIDERTEYFASVKPRQPDKEGDTEVFDGVSFTHHFVEAPGDYDKSAGITLRLGPLGKSTHHCIAIDLKGYGQSEKEPGNYPHEGVAEQMFAMLTQIGVHKFNVVTHDRGTVQADLLAANHPDAVLRYARGEQHLYHFNPVLAPQHEIFMNSPWTGTMEDPKRFAVMVYTWIAIKPIPDAEMTRVIQEFSYPGIVRAVPRYFNSSTFRQEWLERRRRLLRSWKCPVVIMQGYNSKTQPREFYEAAREYIPNAKAVKVRYMPGGHFWTLESPTETTDAIKLLLTL